MSVEYFDDLRLIKTDGSSMTYTRICEIWRLIWRQKCGKLVMLCNVPEAQNVTCDRYVLTKGLSGVNGIRVTCENVQSFANYTVKTFKLQSESDIQTLVNFNFTAWPTNAKPDVKDLVAFRNEVHNTIIAEGNGPTLVYCSSDEGRVGTYIALDMLTKESAAEGSIDILRCVRKLREQCASMIPSADNYEYLHRALVCSMSFYTQLVDISQREHGNHQYEQYRNDTDDYITPV